MRGDDIRSTFLAFFQERDHRLYPSSSLVPPPETNLLLTTAGMVQFRPYFLGLEQPPHPRAVSVQKSFRTTDLEEVGDQTHLTFFEMLGNFSFGDYFKREAIAWAWELTTERYGLHPERLWVTVYEEDDESERLWLEETDVSLERIQRLGKDTNFWDMGVPGPGGPNSELFYDRGPEYGEAGGPEANDTRYMEIYNLVFMQFETDGSKNPLTPLARPSVDTGMGLERMATVLQGAPSIYDTDLFRPLLERAAELAASGRGQGEGAERLLRILADHARAAAFLVADGVTPSNEGRGYILRRIVRRAVTQARLEGVGGKLLGPLCDVVVELFGHVYPELVEAREGIRELVGREEERFLRTLEVGLGILDEAIDKASGGVLGGEVAFRLQDTFGFPLDITKDVAEARGLRVDTETYERLMAEQRERSRSVGEASKHRTLVRLDLPPTAFLGYESLVAEGRILALVRGTESVAEAGEGEDVDVIVDQTPFYPEGGGQIGDRGQIVAAEGRAEVLDTQRLGSAIVHRARVVAGSLRPSLEVHLEVAPRHRLGAAQAHTATHVLHYTLRDVLGTHVRQMGSLVEPGRLRFDFSHFEAVHPDVLAQVEEEVNARIASDDEVRAFETSLREAVDRYHAMAFFEEKYGDVVRVVEIGGYSYELCGGTHVPHTGRVGFVKLLGEGSIGSNLRRLEALTGLEGLRWVNARLRELERAAELVRVGRDELLEGVERLVRTQKELERRLEEERRRAAQALAEELVSQARDVDGARLLVARRSEPAGMLREVACFLRDRLGPSIVILGTTASTNLVAAVTPELGIDAREVLRAAASHIEGKAGGRPELAMGGGRRSDGLEAALSAAAHEAERLLSRARSG